MIQALKSEVKDAFGIAGGYVQDESGEGRKYYRVWKQVDVSDDEGVKRFQEMLKVVFKNLALRVTVDKTPTADTHVASFLERMRSVPSLFFN